jgi:CO/xanthine dehydrogenase Mo-binding subunit/aerobic-type carbon monoxide dehydrogenase small subunit (CoxS/CutS family)
MKDQTGVNFDLNGSPVAIVPRVGVRLSESLREELGARDVKVGCNAGDCGACSVLIDGELVCACLTTSQQAKGRQVTTLRGLQDDPIAQEIKAQFAARGAAQCGICTPGMLVSAVALLRKTPAPTEEQVKYGLGGVLCRCTGYRAIIDAVVAAGAKQAIVANDATGHVGANVRRIDGAVKLDGDEAFGDDIAPPGTLVIEVIRSPFKRASFELINVEAFVSETLGIECFLSAADVTGINRFGVIPGFQDQPVFAETIARFRGEAVAAIVGTPSAIANLKTSDLPVSWQELPSVDTSHSALEDEAPQLHQAHPSNVMCGGFVECGDVDAALDRAVVTVSGRFETGFVEHAYIEPEAGFAQMVDGRLEVHACTQAPVMDLDTLEEVTGLDRAKIRVVPTAAGGGFGSKLDVSVQPFIALAAMKTGKSVRINYSRVESMQSTTKRHPSDITLEVGATTDGKLCGFRFDGLFNTGAYASWGPTVANRVPIHASGPYSIADYRAVSRGIYTNCPPAGAFRGFGVPQSAISQECLFDELADKLGMDRLEFRILNALNNNEKTVCGQVFTQGVGIKACLEALRPAWVAERTWAGENSTDAIRYGVGLAAGWYGCGNTSLPNPSTIKSGIRADGTLVLHQGATDIGQGANTVIAQIFATSLGVPLDKIEIVGGDTDVTPDAGKTSASRQTYVSGEAARLSGQSLRNEILSQVRTSPSSTITLEPYLIRINDNGREQLVDTRSLSPDNEGFVLKAIETYDPPTKPLDVNGQGEPYAQFGYAAHLAVVAVDTALGTVTPVKFVAAHDVGKAINPMLVEGQVHGGIAQGLGMALMEEYIPGRTENLHDYLIPTIGDISPIETLIIEEPDAHGPYGAKGLGEHVLIPTAPAILNAIKDATGVRITKLPATPSRVHAALKEVGFGR